jgi:hypothetical protein
VGGLCGTESDVERVCLGGSGVEWECRREQDGVGAESWCVVGQFGLSWCRAGGGEVWVCGTGGDKRDCGARYEVYVCGCYEEG